MFKSLFAAVALLFVCTSSRAQSLQLFPIKNYVTYDRAQNTLTVVLGYRNGEGVRLNVPFGSNNIFFPSPFFRGQPTSFEPGVYNDVFTVTFPASSFVEWTLGETTTSATLADISPIQYQGRLTVDGVATNGLMDFQFLLFDAASGGNQLLNTLVFSGTNGVPVNNGLFNVTLMWSPVPFTNGARWLEIQTRTPGTSNFVTLTPRQPITTTPLASNSKYLDGLAKEDYAQLAGTNTFRNTVTAPAFAGNGGQLTNLNASSLVGAIPNASLSSNVALLDREQTFSAAMKLGPALTRGSYPGRLEIEQGAVNEPALRLSSASPGHGSGLWLENRSGSVNTWAIYTESSGKLIVSKQETEQAALTINPATMNVSVVSLSQTSDRNAKENFGEINALDVLEKVAALDIKRWNFKGDTHSEHIGPMAQDFYAAFGTGEDERHIATVDADGVALAAIQGLNKKLTAKELEIETLRRENKELSERLQRVEELLKRR